ncbi:Proline dehydrogenase [Psidium guajava]|nr:Proline dehydrogenase [Psidium guajava]
MASRIVRRLPSSPLRFRCRSLNSTPSSSADAAAAALSPLTFVGKHVPAIEKLAPAATIDLDNTERLFAGVPTTKLLRSSATLHAAAIEPVVDAGTWVVRSRLMDVGPVRGAVLGAVRRTFFEQFCAGEDAEEAVRTVGKLNRTGLRGMLDYALEDAEDNEACDRNAAGFLRTVESARSLPPSSVSSVVAKITAICPIDLLKRVSDLLRWQCKDPSFHLPWKFDSFPMLSVSSPLYHTPCRPEHLTPQEERDLLLAHQRLQTLCQKCQEANIPLCIDAEYTAVQPGIDYFTYTAVVGHNKHEPVVYGTMQAYLKDARERLLLATEEAERMGVVMGVKLVRGAYMSSETKLAHSLGQESPIHNTIQETHDCFNECASFMLEKIASRSGAVVLATHNVESGKLAASKASDLGIGNGNQRLGFAQLYGMADSFSFGLRNAGFQVSKYMPFGSVDMVIPYLLRRAEENRGMLSASTVDRQLMRTELFRRLKAAIL